MSNMEKHDRNKIITIIIIIIIIINIIIIITINADDINNS